MEISKEDLLKPNNIQGDKNFAKKCYQDMKNIKSNLKQLQGKLINSEYEVSINSNNINYTTIINNKPNSELSIYGKGKIISSKPDNPNVLYQYISIWMEELDRILTIDVKYIEEHSEEREKTSDCIAALRFSYDSIKDELTNIQCYDTKELQAIKEKNKEESER